jgi:DNA-binding NtrC family response regulator
MEAEGDVEQLIGASASIQTIRNEIDAAARCDAKVLITGETGVGKDVVARLIHRGSRRASAPMATVNCAGVPDQLIESELFGHVRGSFTDAYRDKLGFLESAAHGTVFLDEVGEMSLRMQAVLLRFLETGEIQRVGADRVRASVNVRVIAATNRDLETETASGGFRRDLFYRLDVIRISVPPLRERRDDIPLLLDHFLDVYRRRHAVSSCRLSAEARERLITYSWPGNIRQLKNIVERLVLKSSGATIERHDLPNDLWEVSDAALSHQNDPVTVREPAVDAELWSRMLVGGESFWSAVYAPFISRDLTRAHLKAVVTRGLERTSGNYRLVVDLFNMRGNDYRRFLGCLRKHGCHVPYQAFREMPARRPRSRNDAMPFSHVSHDDARPPGPAPVAWASA